MPDDLQSRLDELKKSPEKQLQVFKRLLPSFNLSPTHRLRRYAQEFVDKFPGDLLPEERRELNRLIKKAFNIPDALATEPFGRLIPHHGWLRDYYEYTLQSEAPAVFHFMSALTVLGAALERRVYLDKGYYRVYPNLATVLIAPTGKCRKTSATNIALRLAREADINVLSERITPEALVQGLSGRETATGIVYAPELAVFIGKQKYMEGMIPLLTGLFDCPDRWSSRTIGRGELPLANVALSLLGASTLEWFVDALPHAAFTGGFMARILFIAQQETVREYAFPIPGAGESWERLREQLKDIMDLKGEVYISPRAKEWYESWYSTHLKTPAADEKFAGYHSRKPDHLLRVAILLRIADTRALTLLPQDMTDALKMLDWLEKSLPEVFAAVTETPEGAMVRRILDQLQEAGGTMTHSMLLRKNTNRVSAKQFYELMNTLIDSGQVTRERALPSTHQYHLVKEEEE